MNELTIINQNGGHYIDSRQVAEVIGKRHDHLLRDIENYLGILDKSNAPKIGGINFFLKSSYIDSRSREKPCYLLTKMGCEMVANKLTGDKGVLFTAAYVTKFNAMEAECAKLEANAVAPTPRLGEYNAAARLIVRALKNAGAAPDQIVSFLSEVYEPLGICINMSFSDEGMIPWYTAKEIAINCGVYSFSGRPHAQAVACILNENIFIGAEHKRVDTASYGDHINVSVHYDLYALHEVMQWLVDNELPDDIYGFARTYHVQYKD